MSKNPNAHFIELAKLVSEAGQLARKNTTGGIEAHLTALLISLGDNADAQLKKEANTFRDSNGRPVVDLEVEGGGVDAFFSAATYDDDGSKVSDEELDYLAMTYPEEIEEQCAEKFAMRCEDAYDAARGH